MNTWLTVLCHSRGERERMFASKSSKTDQQCTSGHVATTAMTSTPVSPSDPSVASQPIPSSLQQALMLSNQHIQPYRTELAIVQQMWHLTSSQIHSILSNSTKLKAFLANPKNVEDLPARVSKPESDGKNFIDSQMKKIPNKKRKCLMEIGGEKRSKNSKKHPVEQSVNYSNTLGSNFELPTIPHQPIHSNPPLNGYTNPFEYNPTEASSMSYNPNGNDTYYKSNNFDSISLMNSFDSDLYNSGEFSSNTTTTTTDTGDFLASIFDNQDVPEDLNLINSVISSIESDFPM